MSSSGNDDRRRRVGRSGSGGDRGALRPLTLAHAGGGASDGTFAAPLRTALSGDGLPAAGTLRADRRLQAPRGGAGPGRGGAAAGGGGGGRREGGEGGDVRSEPGWGKDLGARGGLDRLRAGTRGRSFAAGGCRAFGPAQDVGVPSSGPGGEARGGSEGGAAGGGSHSGAR